MKLRSLTMAAAVGAASLMAQCAPEPTPGHPPDCARRDENGDGYWDNGISSSGTTYTCTFSKSFQSYIHETVIWVEVQCAGLGYWLKGAAKNTDNSSAEEQKVSAFCNPRQVAGGAPRSKHS